MQDMLRRIELSKHVWRLGFTLGKAMLTPKSLLVEDGLYDQVPM